MSITERNRLQAVRVREIILGEYGMLMAQPGSLTSKFQLIATGIEFLGACLDRQHTAATSRSEKRFNMAITRLFPERYHHFTKPGSVPNLYLDFRCPLLHRFAPSEKIILISRMDISSGNFSHLGRDGEGRTVIVLESISEDLKVAAVKAISLLIPE